jgi:hypothetical protein
MQTWQRRWLLVIESRAATQLRLSININKWKMVESLFQAVRNKLGDSKKNARQKTAVMLYGNAKFAAAGNGEEGGVQTRSMKRAVQGHFYVPGALEHRTSRSCHWCQKKDVVPSTADNQ